MSQPVRSGLNHVLVGDELGQIKIVQLFTDLSEDHDNNIKDGIYKVQDYSTFTWDSKRKSQHKHRIVRVFDNCLQREPAISRAITNIRPIESIYESSLDTTDKPNNLFLISNKVGQLFVCNTDAIRSRIKKSVKITKFEYNDKLGANSDGEDDDTTNFTTPVLSPIYYNMNNKSSVCGGQPINQTNILVVYQNGDIQHVNIGQDVLQSSLGIKRKAIRLLGMGYNSDAKAIHWRIDGSTGICYFDSDAASAHMNENDPLTEIVLSSPTHKMSKKRTNHSKQELYNQSPCIKSRKRNEKDRLVPTQVINMITSRAENYKTSSRVCNWSSITSLNLIYRKLALYDLVGSENFERSQTIPRYSVTGYKLNDNRLAVGGYKYGLRVYDVQTQKPFYNCKTGCNRNPLACPNKGERIMIGDIDWLGGNKTTRKTPNMLATCSGIDSTVNVYDLRTSKPVFLMNLTPASDDKWEPYENQPKGCVFTRICASGAPYSTAVPSQQLALGSTNGQLHIIDLRFVAKSNRTLGKLSGFCGGSIREIRFVSESFENSKMISCATDRFLRVHRIQTSFTSVISQKLASKVFLSTKPTCIQPICDEINQSYLSNIATRCGSESHISTIGSGAWSPL